MNNQLAKGSIGSLHGQMHTLVRNPFKTGFMRRNYDGAIRTYDTKHHNFIYEASGTRCVGNGWATNFWRGFDGLKLNWDADSKQTASYAMWCAGRDIRKAIDSPRSKLK